MNLKRLPPVIETRRLVLRPIETRRLVLRPLELGDADALQNLFPQWDIVKFLASHVPWPYPPDGALTHLRDRVIPAMEQGTEWSWSIRLRTRPDRLIGGIGLMITPDDNRGFWLDPRWRRLGLMTEAATAVTDYWFEVLGKEVLRVPKAVANVASRRISERSGMRVVATKERDYVSGRMQSELWEITREEWRRLKG